ncbi:hypothetical protein HXX76_015115 [Chlamydomonas incerta]|uniref:Uncharacterized protein n=1 Tax=Chlamydomonas incerta TaxID=51695 RepID=A0A835SPN5_CHLIN|nr:hypothetical protein HXX76_015115 [Chlamydomonas incerta]|eukprot:KAG2423726.1 hypothetical protein HXX76_015115 [Chlamydomonas incerta]
MAPRRRSSKALLSESTDEEQELVAEASGDRGAASGLNGATTAAAAAPAGPEPPSGRPSLESAPSGDTTEVDDDDSSHDEGAGAAAGSGGEDGEGDAEEGEGEGEDDEEPSYIDDGTDQMEMEEDGDDDDDDDDEDDDDEDEDEDGDGDGDNRRPVSIQEFLAWRMLGRVPDSVRARDETRGRYTPFEAAEPQSLPRTAPLWQQLALGTGPAPPPRRNATAHFDSYLDVAADAALQACRTAPYGRHTRQKVLESARSDPAALAAMSYLGPRAGGAPDPAAAEAAVRTMVAAATVVPPPGGGGGGGSGSKGDGGSKGGGSGGSAGAGAGAGAGSGVGTCSRGAAAAGAAAGAGPGVGAASSPGGGPVTRAAAARAAAAAAASSVASAIGRVFSSGGGAAAAAGPAAAEGAAASAAAAPAAAAAAPAFGMAVPRFSPAPPPPGYLCGVPALSAPRLLLRREQGEAAGVAGGWGAAQRRHLGCSGMALPRHPAAVVDSLDSRAYIGQFSDNGQFFVAAFQDRRVRLYDVEQGWRLRKDITTRMCRWTITDTAVSPDQRFVVYSSIIPVVHLVEVGSSFDCVNSIANITEIHEPLSFDDSQRGPNDDIRMGRSFGIWSVQWSGDGREIVAGTNDQSVVVLDVETKRVVARAEGHQDDVNAVTYADGSPNVIVSGSDDTYIKVWDRRTMPSVSPAAAAGSGAAAAAAANTAPRAAKAVGVLVGHTEGLTHLHSRGDGRHVLSNAKDQTAKLWDLRALQAGGSLRDPASAARLASSGRQSVPQFNWDYRWQEYPAAGRVVRHPHDSSLMTYRGHSVQHTLIRAYFSPAHTTGQRFIYTGSVEGGVHVYDVLTGQEVEGSPFRLHRKLVRDVSWHPFEPVMATVSWDGTVARWSASPPAGGSDRTRLQVPGHDAYNDFY